MLSKLKKKLKPRLPGSKRKPDRKGADAGGESVDQTGSLPRPESHVVAGGGHSDAEVVVGSGSRREGNGADGKQVEQVSPSPSARSLVRRGKSDGM